jgi:hypothetical protein
MRIGIPYEALSGSSLTLKEYVLMGEHKLGMLDRGKCMGIRGLSQVKNLHFEVMKNMIF